jgi:hypothetical protein
VDYSFYASLSIESVIGSTRPEGFLPVFFVNSLVYGIVRIHVFIS